METIFDHNPTPEEITAHCGKVITKEEHLSFPTGQVGEYALIYSLYKTRGDEAAATRYKALLPPDYVRSCLDLDDIVH